MDSIAGLLRRRAGCASCALALAAIVLYAVAVASGWMSGESAGYVHWVECVPLATAVASLVLRGVTAPRQRRIWFALAAGMASYFLATLSWTAWISRLPEPPLPSISDALWLAFYPAALFALTSLVRLRVGRLSRQLVLDGLIAALGLAALVYTFVGPAALRSAEGLGSLALLSTFAYPVLDATLLATVAFVFVVTGRRPGRAWCVLALALTSVTLADVIWSNQVAGLIGGSPGIPNLLWFAAWTLMTLAAWAPLGEPGAPASRGRLATGVPVFFAGGALILLVVDHFHELNTAALLLATASAILSLVRATVTVAEERALAESRRQALTDDLTGLPNRRAFVGRLAEAIEAARAGGGTVGLLLLDLDRFKELNDTLGHTAGDDLLAALGPRLEGALGREGRLARLGGDEFGAILPGADSRQALATARALRAAVEQPFDLRGLRISVGVSVGVSLYPEHSTTGDELLRRADIAMYQAKHGGTGVDVYAPERDGHTRDRLVLAADLRHAIAQDRIVVLFQPKADARTGEVGAVEALARWQHHSHGPVSPTVFAALAEQSGLGRELTRRVLERSVRQLASWLAAGRELRVSVNACSADLCDPEFPADVAALLARRRVPARLLSIEVTETAVLADPGVAHGVLERLRELGVSSSLDDFGTGHSSLTHLRRLPVSEIKLDRSFVAGMLSDRQDAAIVRSTVELARELGLRVVAEGVEDDSTWTGLRELGCDEIQGYLLSEPLVAGELEAWLDARRTLRAFDDPVQAGPETGR